MCNLRLTVNSDRNRVDSCAKVIEGSDHPPALFGSAGPELRVS